MLLVAAADDNVAAAVAAATAIAVAVTAALLAGIKQNLTSINSVSID